MSSISQLGRVIVPVSDQDKAIAFYTDKLGFSLDRGRPVRRGRPLGRGLASAGRGGDRALARHGRVPARSRDRDRADDLGREGRARRAEGEGRPGGRALMGGDGTVPLLFMFKDGDGNGLMVVEQPDA